MTNSEAEKRADELLDLLIKHQPTLMPHGLNHSAGSAKNLAQALLTIRTDLIAGLSQK